MKFDLCQNLRIAKAEKKGTAEVRYTAGQYSHIISH